VSVNAFGRIVHSSSANLLEPFGHGLGMAVQGSAHLVSGVSGVVTDLDAASVIRPVTGP
jgi:hypothetical protein